MNNETWYILLLEESTDTHFEGYTNNPRIFQRYLKQFKIGKHGLDTLRIKIVTFRGTEVDLWAQYNLSPMYSLRVCHSSDQTTSFVGNHHLETDLHFSMQSDYLRNLIEKSFVAGLTLCEDIIKYFYDYQEKENWGILLPIITQVIRSYETNNLDSVKVIVNAWGWNNIQ